MGADLVTKGYDALAERVAAARPPPPSLAHRRGALHALHRFAAAFLPR